MLLFLSLSAGADAPRYAVYDFLHRFGGIIEAFQANLGIDEDDIYIEPTASLVSVINPENPLPVVQSLVFNSNCLVAANVGLKYWNAVLGAVNKSSSDGLPNCMRGSNKIPLFCIEYFAEFFIVQYSAQTILSVYSHCLASVNKPFWGSFPQKCAPLRNK